MDRSDPRRLAAIAERQLARLTGRTEREILTIYRSTQEELRSELSRAFERYAVDGSLTQAEMSKYGRLAKLEKELNTITGRGTQRARAATTSAERRVFNEALARQQWTIDMTSGKLLPWGRVSERAVEAAIQSPLADVAFDRLRTGSRQRIRASLARAIVNGQSFPELSREIRKSINGNASDAMRIARTELHRAENEGRLQATEKAKELGVESRKVWLAVQDERTRAQHDEMDGTPADDDGLFTMPDGARGEAPGKIGEPHHDINCRCTYYDEVIEAPEDAPDTEYQSFERWSEQ